MSVNHETNSGHSAKTLFKFTLAANVPQKRVEWHLPAKVRLKKSHFGKPPLTECVLRHPPCQSELAEAPTTFCRTHESPSKTKATGRSSARAKMPDSPASQQYTPRAMPSSATMEGTISSEMEGSVRRVSFAASAPSGQTRLSPDETQFRCFPSGQMAFSPDEMAL